MDEKPPTEFEKIARSKRSGNLVSEFWYFFRQNKKWWLIPAIIVLLFFGAAMLLTSTAITPFIYTLF